MGRVRERWEVEGNIHHHFIGLLRMFTFKKCECSRLGWCLLVRLRGREGGGGGGGRMRGGAHVKCLDNNPFNAHLKGHECLIRAFG